MDTPGMTLMLLKVGSPLSAAKIYALSVVPFWRKMLVIDHAD